METTVDLKTKSYSVIIENGLTEKIGVLVKDTVNSQKVAVVCDDNIKGLYAERVVANLTACGFKPFLFSVGNGEKAKSPLTLINLLQFLCDCRFSRTDTVLALGGGVVGDIAGLAAALYMRGINLIQMPSSLLAMVDSSVGGKTAVDLKNGKNCVGTFYQPRLVVCDTDFLDTLPQEEFSNGLAEIIKYGIIAAPEILTEIQNNGEPISKIIAQCVKIKADIISDDEYDFGKRRVLNLGHTLAHAVEAVSGYTVPHGSAVAYGIACIARASRKAGYCSKDCVDKILCALCGCNLPTDIKGDKKAVLNAVIGDKKRENDNISLVLINDMGNTFVKRMKIDDALSLLESGLEA